MDDCSDTHDSKILWAPWRIEYIKNVQEPSGCIFCAYPKQDTDQKNLIVHRGENGFVIMNRYPYNNGHLMVVPYLHTGELNDLTEDVQIELFNLLKNAKDVLTKLMKPQGFNIGMNIGRIAGAGITDHLHFHIVPRWGGDTNFMPVCGHTKIISEALEETCSQITEGFKNLIENG